MKEITKTITKKYDALGNLIEHTEVIVEKDVSEQKTVTVPSMPVLAYGCNPPFQTWYDMFKTADPPMYKPDITCKESEI